MAINEAWVTVWTVGVEPQLSDKALAALYDALVGDDPRLLQGATTSPPSLECVGNFPVEAACLVGFCGWQGEGKKTVRAVGDYFGEICFGADRRLGEPAACRWLLNWFDDTPRHVMIPLMLEQVENSLRKRGINVYSTPDHAGVLLAG